MVCPQTANDHSTSIQETTKSVHAETVRVVDEQMKDLDVQMRDLDDFVTRARSQNADHLARQTSSTEQFSETVATTFADMATYSEEALDRIRVLGEEVESGAEQLRADLTSLDENLSQPLAVLRDDIQSTLLKEYEPTGETPQKLTYQYPTELPHTAAPDILIAGMADAPTPGKAAAPPVFPDIDFSASVYSPPRPPSIGIPELTSRNPLSMSLREVNPNVTTGSLMFDPSISIMSLPAGAENATLPLLKRSIRGTGARNPKKHLTSLVEGRENMLPSDFSQSTSRRKSPRLH